MKRTTPSSSTRTSPAPLTFDTTFALNHPGAQIATKVYLVLNTGNEARSATMMV